MAQSKEFYVELMETLDKFVYEERETVAKCFTQAGKEAKRIVVAKSPRNTGDYARGWTVRNKKRGDSVETVVHNATDWQLTHLLEREHDIKNKYGKWGRSTPEPHIGQSQEEAEAYLMKLLKENL